MKHSNVNINNCVFIGIALVLFFSSCSIQITSRKTNSSVCELYTAIDYNMEKELLLRIPDSTYIYHKKYLGMEIGIWKRTKDSLFLYPQMYIYDSHEGCEKFGKIPHEYYVNHSLDNITIPYRLYIYVEKDEIIDRTFEAHQIEDKVDNDDVFVQEIRIPLKMRKIKAIKEEKKVMKSRYLYGGNFF